MANIVLAAGEFFEHEHDTETTTTVIEGEVRFTMQGSSQLLRSGQSVSVPPRTLHSLQNVTTNETVVSCICGPADAP